MRLINTTTLILTEFFGANTPPYAILSHTWDPDEVSFQDFLTLSTARLKAGFAKIQGACTQALKEKLEWCWIDTCCIDKTSSAELSEAINSMCAWYGDAVICYAYLSDIPDTLQESQLKEHSTVMNAAQKVFCASKWFTRGWTLQELLAPVKEVFFSVGWKNMGTRNSLDSVLAHATGIERAYLNGYIQVGGASIAKRMSWMAKRETTRVEDLAYCLLGIFEVNMPLLYGEGQRAFTRLQETIMMQSDDQSIFCWVWDSKIMETSWGSILAPCPAAFAMSGHFGPASVRFNTPVRVYHITNAGLSIWLPFVVTPDPNLIFAALQVVSNSPLPGPSHNACIPLNRLRVHCRTPYPAMPILLGSELAEAGKNVYVKSKPTIDSRTVPISRRNTRGGTSLNKRHCETLGNSRDFGFVFITKHQEENAMPRVLISSQNMTISQNVITFSFSGKHASETSGHVVFGFWTEDGMGMAWLAVRTSADAEGMHQHRSYCGSPFVTKGKDYYNRYRGIADDLQDLPESLLKVYANGRASTPAIKLGERIMYSSISEGSTNAQVAFFCNGSVQNQDRTSNLAAWFSSSDKIDMEDILALLPEADPWDNVDFAPAGVDEDSQSFWSRSPSLVPETEDVPSVESQIPSIDIELIEDVPSPGRHPPLSCPEPVPRKLSPSPSPEPLVQERNPEKVPNKRRRLSIGSSVLMHYISNGKYHEETRQMENEEHNRVKRICV